MARYAISDEGKILFEGDQIGTFDVNTGAMSVPEGTSEAAVVHLKALIFDKVVARLRAMAESGVPHPTPPPELVRPPSEPPAPDIPPAPPMDPMLGDKTPAYVQWFGTYHPDKFAEKYKGRRTHLSAGIVNPHVVTLGDVPDSHFRADPEEEWR